MFPREIKVDTNERTETSQCVMKHKVLLLQILNNLHSDLHTTA